MFRDGDLGRLLFLIQRTSNNSVSVLGSPKQPVLEVNMTIQEQVGFIQKPNVIQEFMVIVDNLWKWQVATLFSMSAWVSWFLIQRIKILRSLIRMRRTVIPSFCSSILLEPSRLPLEPWLHSWLFELLSDAYMVSYLLPYDLHKCNVTHSSWPIWKSDSCLEICWNWTSFSLLFEQSWKTSFRFMSSHRKSSAPSFKASFCYSWWNILKYQLFSNNNLIGERDYHQQWRF